MTPAQIAKVVKDLRTKSAVGPGNMIVHTVMAEAADLIEAQAAELAEMRSKQTYRYIGKDGKMILARDLEDQRDALSAELTTLTAWRDAQ